LTVAPDAAEPACGFPDVFAALELFRINAPFRRSSGQGQGCRDPDKQQNDFFHVLPRGYPD